VPIYWGGKLQFLFRASELSLSLSLKRYMQLLSSYLPFCFLWYIDLDRDGWVRDFWVLKMVRRMIIGGNNLYFG
jgi:hypothetical protein